jgi:23S rRNA (pseudouridine1915-N3)-methyltransferase
MLRLKIIVVDRTRSPFLKEGESFYLDRLKRYAHTEWVEVKPESIKKGKPSAQIVAAEGGSITKKLLPRDYLIALDRTGKAFDSKGLAARINELSFSHDRLAFVIGGPLGLSKEVLKKAHETLSLSRLTLTHEMSRLVLLEQLYRAFTIINNEKYHK